MPNTTLVYQGSAVNTANQSSYTFSNCALGTESASRVVIVMTFEDYNNGTLPSVTQTMTIAGVSATRIAIQNNSTPGMRMTAWTARVPTSTSGNIVLTTTTTTANAVGIAWWTSNLQSITTISARTAATTSGLTIQNTFNSVVPNGFVVHGVFEDVNSYSSKTWSGSDSTYFNDNRNITLEGTNCFHTFSMKTSETNTNRSFTFTGSTNRNRVMISLTFDIEPFSTNANFTSTPDLVLTPYVPQIDGPAIILPNCETFVLTPYTLQKQTYSSTYSSETSPHSAYQFRGAQRGSADILGNWALPYTFTWDNASIGEATPDRVVLVHVFANTYHYNSNPMTSLKINGETATRIVQTYSTNYISPNRAIEIYVLKVPYETTAQIQLTYSSGGGYEFIPSSVQMGIHTFRPISVTPLTTSTATTNIQSIPYVYTTPQIYEEGGLALHFVSSNDYPLDASSFSFGNETSTNIFWNGQFDGTRISCVKVITNHTWDYYNNATNTTAFSQRFPKFTFSTSGTSQSSQLLMASVVWAQSSYGLFLRPQTADLILTSNQGDIKASGWDNFASPNTKDLNFVGNPPFVLNSSNPKRRVTIFQY